MSLQAPNREDFYVPAADGLRLHVRGYGAPVGGRRPVVCLPGLARTVDDFDSLATALASDPERPRYVLAVDYRGRGDSGYDPNPANYNVATEIADLLTVLGARGIETAVFVGTSRGGILAMVLATVRPSVIAGAVLNDIGPVIETRGLIRIKGYLGRLPQPKAYGDAADGLRRLFGSDFPKLGPNDWTMWARRTFKEKDGALEPRYDPQLAHALDGLDLERPQPPLWKQFDALAAVPLMTIRGANSDLLSTESVSAMRDRRPDMVTLEIPDQGHAPLLSEPDVISQIARFIDRC